MGWFLADRLVYQVKPEILNNVAKLEFNPDFFIKFRKYFQEPKKPEKRKKTLMI